MAKSEIRATHVWQPIKNLMYHRAGCRENDFTISIAFGDKDSRGQASIGPGPE
jgi:hypothetical protein